MRRLVISEYRIVRSGCGGAGVQQGRTSVVSQKRAAGRVVEREGTGRIECGSKASSSSWAGASLPGSVERGIAKRGPGRRGMACYGLGLGISL